MTKRIFDLALAVTLLILALPFMMLGSCIILLTSGMPIFYCQERCGMGGRRFKMGKFRTMRNPVDGEKRKNEDVAGQDGRLTPIGGLLRKTYVDELPQLWNVFRGDMSIVGPRPMPYWCDTPLDYPYETTDQIPGWKIRNSVRPGITGLAQVACSKMAPRRNKYRFDVLYVRCWSLLLDAKIICRTGTKIIGGWNGKD